MPREAPEIRLIRETLEGVLHPSTASTVFFEAMQAAGGALPCTPDDAVNLVNGSLRASLQKRLGDESGNEIADQLATMLSAINRQVRKRPSRHDEDTQSISLTNETMPVFILTASDSLVSQLHAAVGPKVMSPVVITDAETFKERISQLAPSFVLVDASEFPAIEPEALVATMNKLGSGVIKALWGSDLPYGQAVMDIALKRNCTVTTFDRREGIEPLLDVIRSRRGK